MLSAAFKAEASLWQQPQAKLTGFRTELTARLLAIAGILVGFHDEPLPLVSGQDWTSLTAKLPTWSIPLGMVLIGWLFDRLRKITENPPHVILQKDDAGVPKVVALVPFRILQRVAGRNFGIETAGSSRPIGARRTTTAPASSRAPSSSA
jgi:hypothetical protein